MIFDIVNACTSHRSTLVNTGSIRRRAADKPQSSPPSAPVGQTDFRCALQSDCQACQHINKPYGQALLQKYKDGLATLKEAQLLERTRILDVNPTPQILHYRTSFKLAVRASNAEDRRFDIGLFVPGTHQVTNIDSCPLHHRPLARILPELRDALEDSHLAPYDEKTVSGDVRYIVGRSSHLTGQMILTFVVTRPSVKPELNRIVGKLRQRHDVVGAFCNINPDSTNAILGLQTIKLSGIDRLRESLCDLDFFVDPQAFFQINPWQAEVLYRRVQDIAGTTASDKVAWDLYCGAGQYAMLLANNGYRSLGVEEIPAAVASAKLNAERNSLQDRATFLTGRCEEQTWHFPDWAKKPSVIVVNPSRRGLAAPMRQFIGKTLVENPRCILIYVSCDVTSFRRDCEDLHNVFDLSLRQVEAFDMFAHTEQLEWLGVIR